MFLLVQQVMGIAGCRRGISFPIDLLYLWSDPAPPPGPNETQLVMGITHIRSLKRKGILNIFKTVKTQQTS